MEEQCIVAHSCGNLVRPCVCRDLHWHCFVALGTKIY